MLIGVEQTPSSVYLLTDCLVERCTRHVRDHAGTYLARVFFDERLHGNFVVRPAANTLAVSGVLVPLVPATRARVTRVRLDAASGPLVAWSLPMVELSDGTLAQTESRTYLRPRRIGHTEPWVLLTRPRIVDGDGFRPVDIRDLATVIGIRG